MKKWIWILLLSLVLVGCTAQETFETVGDDPVLPVLGQSMQITMALPEDAAVGAVNADGGRVYWCEDYDITVQTLQGGDIQRTVQTLSGFDMENLSVICTQNGQYKRYEWVWIGTGEAGDQMNRALVISAGNFHYCVTLHTAAENAGALEAEWASLMASVELN